MKKTILLLLLITCAYTFTRAQQKAPDTSLTAGAIKLVLQGVWGGPDESYFFLFRGDSVKEWEADGSDSTAKPFCNYSVSKAACDTSHLNGATGFYMTITCSSIDYNETKCYFIQSINTIDLMIGTRGTFDESGHFKKIKKRQDGGN